MSCGGLLGGLFAADGSEVGQQIVDPGVGPSVDSRHDVGDVAAGVDAGGIGGGDERQLVSEALGAAVGAREKPGFAPRSDGSQSTFGQAVVNLETTVEGEGHEQLVSPRPHRRGNSAVVTRGDTLQAVEYHRVLRGATNVMARALH